MKEKEDRAAERIIANYSDYSQVILIIGEMQGQPIRPINEHYGIVEGQLLGKGSTGNVYLGRERNGPNRVAIKTIDLREVDNEVTRYLLSCQIAALSNLGKIQGTAHQNIIKLLDIVIQDHFIYLVMELLEGGTLAEYIRRHPNGLSQDDSLLIFRQILEGYRHIRTKRIIHRDLKPDNILFRTRPEAGLKVAIIDFGYCQMDEVPNKPQIFYNVGSPKYMAPEAYKQNQYSEKSDIWALGVVFYEMLVGRTCDQGMNMETYLEMIEHNGVPFPQTLPNFYRKIISSMLIFSHQMRYDCFQALRELDSFQSILSHQRSQLLLPRESYNQNDLRSTQQFYRNDRNKNSNIFRSMIVGQQPTAANSCLQMQPSQINISPSKQLLSDLRPDNSRFEDKFLKISNRPPGVSIHQFQYPQVKQTTPMVPVNITRSQNVDMQSVKQIIQRKFVNNDAFAMPHTASPQVQVQLSVFQSQHPPQLPPPQQINPYLSYHNHPNSLNTSLPPPTATQTSVAFHPRPETLQFRPDTSPRQKIHFNFIPNGNQNAKLNQIIFDHHVQPAVYGHRRDQRFNTAPQQQTRNSYQTHDAMRMSIQKEIIPKQIYHSPERKLITLASKVQFFTGKKENMMDTESPPKLEAQPQRPVSRPIINLRPSFNTDSRPTFVRLQPHFLRNPEGRTFTSFRWQ